MQNEEDVGAGIKKREEHFVTDECGILRGGCCKRGRGSDAREPRGCCGVAGALEKGEERGVVGGGVPGARNEDNSWFGGRGHGQE